MAEHTKIEWATHTFSPWIGCSHVHAGCQNCYAEILAGRLGVTWGPNGTRRRTAESTWRKVGVWNRKAQCNWADGSCASGHGEWCPQRSRPRVFPSLCDPFEDWGGPVADWQRGVTTMQTSREDFFRLIDRNPNLDWLLLTKRPENVRRMWQHKDGPTLADIAGPIPCLSRGVPWSSGWRENDLRSNVWLLCSTSDQASYDAGRETMFVTDLVPVWGFSLEPLLGPIALGMWEGFRPSWIIVGGESGPRARPMNISWMESIAGQCEAAGVPLFVKQDFGGKPGRQGRIPDWLWAKKELPEVVYEVHDG